MYLYFIYIMYIIYIYATKIYLEINPPLISFSSVFCLDLGFGSRFCSCASSTSINTLTGNSQIRSMMTLKPWWGSQVELFFSSNHCEAPRISSCCTGMD